MHCPVHCTIVIWNVLSQKVVFVSVSMWPGDSGPGGTGVWGVSYLRRTRNGLDSVSFINEREFGSITKELFPPSGTLDLASFLEE